MLSFSSKLFTDSELLKKQEVISKWGLYSNLHVCVGTGMSSSKYQLVECEVFSNKVVVILDKLI